MPLSSYMAKVLAQFDRSPSHAKGADPELNAVQPLLNRQRESSIVPNEDELHRALREQGRASCGGVSLQKALHPRGDGLAPRLRMSLLKPITFSIAMNDYGFELLATSPSP